MGKEEEDGAPTSHQRRREPQGQIQRSPPPRLAPIRALEEQTVSSLPPKTDCQTGKETTSSSPPPTIFDDDDDTEECLRAQEEEEEGADKPKI